MSMQAIFEIQRAVSAARERLADPTIGATVKAGSFNVVRVTYLPAGKRKGLSHVEQVAGGFTKEGCVAYLDRMA